MDIDLFPGSYGGALTEWLERVLSAYPPVFRMRVHDASELDLLRRLWLAALPLDETTGHGPFASLARMGEGGKGGRGEWGAGPGSEIYANCYAYDGYDACAGCALPTPAGHGCEGAAIALFNRIALVDGPGPVVELRPGVWRCLFSEPESFRAVFNRALRHALAEAHHSADAMYNRRPDIPEVEADTLLELMPGWRAVLR